jgi:gliding motility-associated-like protein
MRLDLRGYFLFVVCILAQLSDGFSQLTLGFNSNGNTAGCAPYTLTFPISNVSGNPATTTYTVNFGDGSPILNFTQANIPASVTHTYTTNSCGSSFQATPNVYGATITANNPSFSPFTAAVSPIVISSGPTADITASSSVVCVGSTVNIQNNSDEGVFIDPSAGYGCLTNSALHYYTVTPAAGWTASAANLGTNNGFPSPLDFDVWTEGTSTLPVTFTAPGNYRVKIWIANSCGQDTMSLPICVVPPPVPQFTFPTVGCLPPNVSATATNTTAVTSSTCFTTVYSYTWTVSPGAGWAFNAGSTANSVFPSFTFSQAGNYTVTLTTSITGATGCSASTNRTIVINQAVPASAGLDQSVCVGSSPVQLSGSPAGGTWSGTGVSGSGLFTPSTIGNFNLTYTYTPAAATGCPPQTDVMVMSVTSPQAANAGLDQNICLGASPIQLTGSPAGGTWSGAGVTAGGLFTPSVVGNVTLTYGFPAGSCYSPNQMVVTVYGLPTVTVNDATICAGTSTSLTAIGSGGLGPYTYSWSPSVGLSASTGATVSANPASTSNYTVTVTDAHQCIDTDISTVTVNPLPSVFAGNNLTLCNVPVATQLTGSPSPGTWTGTGVTAGGAFTPPGLGTFTLTYTHTNSNNCTASDNVDILVEDITSVNAGLDQEICLGSVPIQLTGNQANGVWTGTNVTSTGVFTPSSVGTFTLTFTVGAGICAFSDQKNVTVNPVPSVAVNNAQYCAGEQATLTAVGNGGTTPYFFSWSPSTDLSSTTGISVTTNSMSSTSYIVTLEDDNGCEATATSTVTVIPMPTVDAGLDQVICLSPTTIQLNGTPATGTWSGDNVTVSGAYTPVVAGIDSLFFTFSQNGCSISDTMIINVQQPSTLVLTPDTSVCFNSGSFQLYSNPSGGNWSTVTAATLSSGGLFTPNQVGSFTVNYTVNLGSCNATGSLVVTVIAPPVVEAGPNLTACVNGGIVNFSGESPTTGGTWNWSGPGIINPITGTFNPQLAGVGTAEVFYQFTDGTTGCSSQDSLDVLVNPIPPILLQPANLGVCLTPFGSTLTALPVGGTWSGNGLTFSSNNSAPNDTATYTPTAVGNFEVYYTYTNALSCTNVDTVSIVVSLPSLANAGVDTAFCFNTSSSVQLIGLPGTATWVGPSWLASNGLFIPYQVGTHEAVLSNGSGSCLVYDTALVTVYPLPLVNAGSNVSFCQEETCVALAAPSPLGGIWSGPGLTNFNTGIFCPQNLIANTYELYYTWQNPATTCVNRDTLVAVIHPMPVPGVGIDPLFCINTDESVLNLSSGPADLLTYNITNLNTNALALTSAIDPLVVNLPAVANYRIEQICTSLQGCETRDTAFFSTVAPPVAAFQLSNDIICGPTVETVANTSTGLSISYLWNFGSAGPTSTDTIPTLPSFPAPIINDSLYRVTLTVTNFCGVSVAADSVLVRPVPVAEIGTDYSQGCSPFMPNFQNVSYGSPDWFSWDFGNGSTSTDSLPSALTYTSADSVANITIVLNIGNTCGNDQASTSIVVFPDQINPNLFPSVSGCSPFEVNYSVSLGNLTFYLWDFGDNTGMSGSAVSHVYEEPGTYEVELQISNFCLIDSVSTTVTVLDGPEISFTIDQESICQSQAVSLQNASTNSVNVWVDFGDGSSEPFGSTANHTYLTGGNQSISVSGQNPVTGCTDTLIAEVEVVAFPTIQVTADPDTGCMPFVVQFFNASTNANGYQWYFADGTTSVLPQPTLSLPAAGDFPVQLIAHNFQGNGTDCPDTLNLSIHVDPSPSSSFVLAADSACGPPASTTVTNTSVGAVNFLWEWESFSSTEVAPTLDFSQSGLHNVRLIAENIFACRDTSNAAFMLFTEPDLDFEITPLSGCAPLMVNFNNLTTAGDSVRWAFGDGQFSNLDETEHLYTDPGLYSVELYVSNGKICADDSILVDIIAVKPKAIAALDVSPQVISEDSPSVNLLNGSVSADQFELYIDDQFFGSQIPPSYLFVNPDTGFVDIMLVANNIFNCPDTTLTQIFIEASPKIFVPTSFSPNEDGTNDGFKPILDRPSSEYYFSVYDRWGHIVFETRNEDVYWDGTFKNKGDKPIKQDVYVYKLKVVFGVDQIYNEYGNITVIH